MALAHRLRRRGCRARCGALCWSAALSQPIRGSVITIWHQVAARPSATCCATRSRAFEAAHPDVRVRPLYKETEELRSGFQAAALAGGGPELVYGPSDVLDTFHTMGIIAGHGAVVSGDELRAISSTAR